MSRNISENDRRRLIAESMGRCMNPDCKEELFQRKGDIIERGHIVPYCKTKDSIYENLIILCPNCHTKYDKTSSFSEEEVKTWKNKRLEELSEFFAVKFSAFQELEQKVKPILIDNKTIFENYFVENKKELWNQVEDRILSNNKKIKLLIGSNLHLLQRNTEKTYSNLELINKYLLHIDEFERTRDIDEKERHVLFPPEINSIFGIAPVNDSFLPSVESVEVLIGKLIEKDLYEGILIGIENPFIQLNENGNHEMIFLKDTPRIRQLYNDYNCFRKANVRIDDLNYILSFMKSKNQKYMFREASNLRSIKSGDTKIIFIYEYCLTKVGLEQLLLQDYNIIVNLHGWNGDLCISKEAYELASEMNVTLYTKRNFMGYLNGLSK